MNINKGASAVPGCCCDHTIAKTAQDCSKQGILLEAVAPQGFLTSFAKTLLKSELMNSLFCTACRSSTCSASVLTSYVRVATSPPLFGCFVLLRAAHFWVVQRQVFKRDAFDVRQLQLFQRAQDRRQVLRLLS